VIIVFMEILLSYKKEKSRGQHPGIQT